MNKSCFALGAVLSCLIAGHVDARTAEYAEGIYSDFSEMHEGVVRFDVTTLREGGIRSLSGAPMWKLIGVPLYSVVVDDSDFLFPRAGFADVNADDIYLQDLDSSVDGFAEAGFPLENGRYRMLDVSVQLNGETRSHQAIEFCWDRQGHCVVFDAHVDFIDSEVNSYRIAVAEGWGIRVHEEPAESIIGEDGAAVRATCGLASRPSTRSRSYSRSSRTVTYRNVFRIVMVQKTIGAVQAGLRCNSSCYPDGFGYANASSAWANIPFSVNCGRNTNYGRTGRRGKFVTRSGCAHRTVLGANFSVTRAGTGANVTLNINSTGSVDSNGTSIIDTCGYY